jgi:hypothetical protein
VPGSVNEMSSDSRRLRDEWLRGALGVHHAIYEAAPEGTKRAVLIDILQAILARSAQPSTDAAT